MCEREGSPQTKQIRYCSFIRMLYSAFELTPLNISSTGWNTIGNKDDLENNKQPPSRKTDAAIMLHADSPTAG